MHFRGGSGSAPSSGRIPEKGDERIRNVLIRGDRLAHGRNTGHICRNVLVSGARARDHGYPALQQVLRAADPGHGKGPGRDGANPAQRRSSVQSGSLA
jgi:hypothetical protein